MFQEYGLTTLIIKVNMGVNMSEPNWVITTIIGTILGLLIPVLLKVLYYFFSRFTPDVILGKWTEYTMCADESGKTELRINDLSIKRGLIAKYKIIIKDNELDFYEGSEIFHENHHIIFNLKRASKHGENENINLRYK